LRQLLTESLLLGVVAGVGGLVLAHWIGAALTQSGWLPETVDLTPDLTVFGFVLAVTVITSLAAGLAPARHAASRDVLTSLKSGHESTGIAPRSVRLRNLFLGAQAAASIVLLVLASLFGRALVRNYYSDFGFDVDRIGVVTFFYSGDDAVRLPELQDAAIGRIRALPGVEIAALADGVPFDTSFHPVQVESAGPRDFALVAETSAEYFSTLGVRVVRGRMYSETEVRGHAPVAVVSAALVRRFWAAEDPIGTSLRRISSTMAAIQIIGVTDDVSLRIGNKSGVVFLPLADSGKVGVRILFRARDNTPSLIPVVTNALLPIFDEMRKVQPKSILQVGLVSDELDKVTLGLRLLATVATGLGVLALLLAVVGLTGVTAFVVHQRTREIGIRLTLGATKKDILHLLLRQGLRPVVIGLAVGLIVALAASGLLAGFLYGIGPRDPIAIAAAVVTLLVFAAMAVFVPAHRATRLDPALVLRE
jgi:predicted permease